MGATIVHNIPDSDHTFIQGLVKDYLIGEPIKDAELDVWHTAPNGLYEQQDENQVEHNLRGRFTTGKNGRYSFCCLQPPTRSQTMGQQTSFSSYWTGTQCAQHISTSSSAHQSTSLSLCRSSTGETSTLRMIQSLL